MEYLLVPALLYFGLTALLSDGSDPAETTDDDTPEPERETFGNGPNRVLGGGGSEFFDLRGGDDEARMGGGDDTVIGGRGDDALVGGAGDDVILMGAGNDDSFVTQATGFDLRAGNFIGDDLIRGGSGADRVVDFHGSDRLFGGAGADLLDAVDAEGTPTTPDRLFGGDGTDVLFGDEGDRMSGGAGIDDFSLIIDADSDSPAVITDYEVSERIFVSVPLLTSLDDGELTVKDGDLHLMIGDQTVLVLKDFDRPDLLTLRIVGSDFADQSNTPDDLVWGSNGDDTIGTGDGDDAIFAARGDDVIDAGRGDDYVSLRTARPFEDEGPLGFGDNTVDAGKGRDQVIGGLGDDRIEGGGGADLIIGGGGQDQLFGGADGDRIDARDSERGQADRIFGGSGSDVISADDGDRVSTGSGSDIVILDEWIKRDAVVQVTDFDPDRDLLDVAVPGGDLTVSFEAQGDDTRVLIGGRAVFDLAGLAPGALSAANVRVTSYA